MRRKARSGPTWRMTSWWPWATPARRANHPPSGGLGQEGLSGRPAAAVAHGRPGRQRRELCGCGGGGVGAAGLDDAPRRGIRDHRRSIRDGRWPGAAVLAGAQLLAIAVFIAGIEAEVGREDEWVDYPAAGGIALLVVAALTIAGIIRLTWDTCRLKTLP